MYKKSFLYIFIFAFIFFPILGGNTVHASDDVPSDIYGTYHGEGTPSDGGTLFNDFTFRWYNFDTSHDVCVYQYQGKKGYNLFKILKNSNVKESVTGIRKYINDSDPTSNYSDEYDYFPETDCGGIYSSGYSDVNVTFATDAPLFTNIDDCKAYLKDGTVGDSLVEQGPQVNEDTPVDYPHNFLVSIPSGLVGSYKDNTTSTGTNIKVTWTQKKNDEYQEVYHTEFVCYKVKGKCTDSYLLPDMRTWYEFTLDNKVYWDESLSNFDTGSVKDTGREYRRVIGRDTFRDFIKDNASFSDITKVCPYYFYNNKEDVVWKLRNYIILPDGSKKYSDWSVLKGATYVLATDNDDSDGDVISSDSDFSQNLEDKDGKSYSEKDRDAPTKNDSKNKTDSSSPSNIFEWFSCQINGLSDFLASVKSAFKQANDTGSSFIAMFKSYNSWLPEAFVTMLVTGIGIVVFLRILGR